MGGTKPTKNQEGLLPRYCRYSVLFTERVHVAKQQILFIAIAIAS